MKLFVVISFFVLLSACAKKPLVKKSPEEVPAPPPVIESKEEPSVRAEWETIPEVSMVHFDFDKSEIRADAREILKKNAEYLKKNPDVKILVEGHCDERGTVEYNLSLGQRRALAVRDYYGRLGVALGRIATISYGEEKPLDPASNETAWAKNRRAETKIGRR